MSDQLKNKFHIENISNAFLKVSFNDHVVLCDPWLTNRIFDNSWMVYPPVLDVRKAISGVTHVFISHIHQDHYDLNLIKLLPRSTKILIPNLFPNNKIADRLKQFGFDEVLILDLEKDYSIEKDLNFFVIPPMNDFGQETENMKKDQNYTGVPIDTGIIIYNEYGKLCAMGDNSPYYFEKLNNSITKLDNTDILFIPYNGYSSDFPLNFINFTEAERTELSYNQSLNRLKLQSKFIKKINPKNVMLYSSDFALAGPNAINFVKIHPEEWRNKKKATKIYEKETNIPTTYLYVDDKLTIDNKSFYNLERLNDFLPDPFDFAESVYSKIPNTRNLFKKVKSEESLDRLFQNSCETLFKKTNKVDLKSKSIFSIELTDSKKKYFIDLNKQTFGIGEKDFSIKVFLESSYFQGLLNFESHWNDAQISHNLYWSQPSTYDPAFDTLINFFHKEKIGPLPIRL
jgi:L-ascorbate metabolism protein UlaG (beta-lactamase superfamily)